jgi:hypothetical protein
MRHRTRSQDNGYRIPSFSELKSELKKLKLSDLEKLISHVESNESLTLNNINKEDFKNAIGNTSFAELSETFIDDSTKSNLAKI